MKSWKIGAISGLIAGIVASIVAVIIRLPLIFKLGLDYYFTPVPPETPFVKIAVIEITFIIIWGIILGIIYSRIQDLIPGKGILKGLIFGLAYYVILSIRGAIFMGAYGYPLVAYSALLRISPIIYGLILGLLYKAPKQKFKISKHNMKSGVIPGAITGLIWTMVVITFFILSAYFGIILGFLETFPAYLTDIGFIIGQIGSHGWINMLFYAIFGAFYAKFYDRIPGKSIVKGAVFGLILWLLTTFPDAIRYLAYGQLGWAFQTGLLPDIYIFVGILLEGIYSKRIRTILIAGLVYAIIVIRIILTYH